MNVKRWLTVGLASSVVILIAGCGTMRSVHRNNGNSLYNFLYANQPEHVDVPVIPKLSLPLRVGMAFVPVDHSNREGRYYYEDATFTESQKMELMQQVSRQFRAYPFINSIELIPTPYLQERGGFANLEQLHTIYGVDVMVLLSYDQVQFTDEHWLSVTYWTILGAYFVPGELNDTRTLLDAAVYDIPSRKLLFRAPGVGNVKGSASPLKLSEQLRKDSEQGFNLAATNLVVNLREQLEQFQERVKQAPQDYQIEYRPGYKGGGAVSGWEAAWFGSMGAGFWWLRRKGRV